ncbi:hypothetical protein K438DRAFT_1787736 [Mycena galopus ATCC 62051]|nr:hypothetical protein K438DRAFT_1787736 [Mycena galopus ATCC 62051]
MTQVQSVGGPKVAATQKIQEIISTTHYLVRVSTWASRSPSVEVGDTSSQRSFTPASLKQMYEENPNLCELRIPYLRDQGIPRGTLLIAMVEDAPGGERHSALATVGTVMVRINVLWREEEKLGRDQEHRGAMRTLEIVSRGEGRVTGEKRALQQDTSRSTSHPDVGDTRESKEIVYTKGISPTGIR